MAVNEVEVTRIAAWVERHDFARIAVQFPDELLAEAPLTVAVLQQRLRGRLVFVLGDSTFGSSCVDEVGALHYGADCIVHVGPSDQVRGSSLPVLFVFGRAQLGDLGVGQLLSELSAEFGPGHASLVLVCDVTLQHEVQSKLEPELSRALEAEGGELLVAVPEDEMGTSSALDRPARWRDPRFGAISLSSWWASLGPLLAAVYAEPDPLRICGRRVLRASGCPAPKQLPERCGIIFVGTSDSGLERRLLLRHGSARPIWRIDGNGLGTPERLSNAALLLKRYRHVELVKSAERVGILLVTTGASFAQAEADRCEELLRRSGRRSYRFVIGQLTPEKLANFIEVELFVSLASPENFPHNTKDFAVPIASPYELEVALGCREWTGDYITDIDELLCHPLPPQCNSNEEALSVQTLGAGGRLRHFEVGSWKTAVAGAPARDAGSHTASAPPALVQDGLIGTAAGYISEHITIRSHQRCLKDAQ